MSKAILFFCLILCCSQLSMLGQEVKNKRDSLAVVSKIKKFSSKNKFNKTLSKFIFRISEPKSRAEIRAQARKDKKKYKAIEGKIIRNIYIKTLDPFGFSVTDTTARPKRWLSKVGNTLHSKTFPFVVRNFILFKKNTSVDSLLFKETERLIRSQRYIRRVNIEARPITNSADSVDVYVTTLDSWSTIPNGAISTSNTTVEVKERNFLGLGHEWDNRWRKNLNNQRNAFATLYTIPNIENTFISAQLSYAKDENNNLARGILIQRNFFSPLTRWAGGIDINRQFRTDSLPDLQNNLGFARFKSNNYDFWVGHAIQLFKGKTEGDRTTHLINSIRYFRVNYLDSPNVNLDRPNFFDSEKLALTTIGITSRNFIQDTYLFNFDIIEDIPIGEIIAITGGYQFKNKGSRTYLGTTLAYGNYFSWGYCSLRLEWGSFYRASQSEQSAFVLQGNYFTNLIEMGRWKLRQFIKPSLTIGNDRVDNIADQLTINNDRGLNGFNSRSLVGTKRVLLNCQTQTYSPWQFAGFRLSPFFNYTGAILGNASGFATSKLYSKLSLGVLFTNDYLVFNSFQFSLSYYPNLPPDIGSSFLTNTLRTTDFGIPNYELNKPQLVDYR